MSISLHLTNATTTSQATSNGADFINILGNAGQGKKPYGVSIRSIGVAHAFPNINEHCRVLRLRNNVPDIIIERSLNVGQYTTDQLLTTLNGLFGGIAVFQLRTPTADNPTPGFIDIMMLSGVPTGASVLFSPGGLAELLGFTQDTGVIAQFDTVTSQMPVNLGGPRMLFVHSRRLGHGKSLHGDGSSENVIETINIGGTPYGGYAFKDIHDPTVNAIVFDSEEELSTIDIYVTDERMRRLTLPTNHQMDIVFHALHRED